MRAWRRRPVGGGRTGGASASAAGAVFSDASASSITPIGPASGWAREVSRPGFAAFGMSFGRAFESCPIMQPYRTSLHSDKRGGFRATQRDKPPHKFIMPR